ncbi:hypothetical protein KCP75_22145 [Salmonella enterica subsp. enterica]|nr:hypothetical protein KCP75_22145 [Salmonella enterica subsp. enterica]
MAGRRRKDRNFAGGEFRFKCAAAASETLLMEYRWRPPFGKHALPVSHTYDRRCGDNRRHSRRNRHSRFHRRVVCQPAPSNIPFHALLINFWPNGSISLAYALKIFRGIRRTGGQ